MLTLKYSYNNNNGSEYLRKLEIAYLLAVVLHKYPVSLL